MSRILLLLNLRQLTVTTMLFGLISITLSVRIWNL